jgi:type VI protein secretion system component Hcp
MIDAFLELTDFNGNRLTGESSDDAFPGQIEVYDFGLGDGSAAGESDDETTEKVADSASRAEDRMNSVLAALAQIAENRDKNPTKTATTALTNAKEVANLIAQMKKDIADGSAKAKTAAEKQKTDAEAKEAGGKKKKGPDELTFSVSKQIDSSSPELFQAYCWSQAPREAKEKYKQLGKFRSAKVTVRKLFAGDPHPYLICTFQDVEVHQYGLKFDSGRATMVEDLAFKFIRFQVQYQVQTATGDEGRVLIVDGTTAQTAQTAKR